MPGKKISELQQVEFTGDKIDNCFYVKDVGTNDMSAVPMRSVFDWIKNQAQKEGLEVELKGDSIIFKPNM